MPEDIVETPAEVTEEVSSSAEVVGGSPHFAIGDTPPGIEAADSEPTATDTESGGGVEQEVVVSTPPDNFFTFTTADGQAKEFTSPEDAQQFFSSWNGRLSKAERELQEVTNYNLQWQQAYDKGELASQKAPEATQQQGNQQQGEAKPKEEKIDMGALEPHDWANVENLLKEGDGVKAVQYIQWKNNEFLKKQVEGLRDEFRGQIDDVNAPAKFQDEVAQAMTYVAEQGLVAVDDMGQPLYPEFQDGDTYSKDFVHHFRDVWLNQDYKMATSPDGSGFRAAYYEARTTFRPQQEPSEGKASDFLPPPTTPAEAVANSTKQSIPRNPDGTFAKRNQALSMSETEPTGASRPAPGSRAKKNDILEAMRQVGVSKSPHFAVTPD